MDIIKEQKAFDGILYKVSHQSEQTKTKMLLSIYHPDLNLEAPVQGCLVWLSGLTCNEDNFVQKSGALSIAKSLNICLVCPDTSPRGLGLVGEDESWDFGTGAGFYLDATSPPWDKNYRMESYVVSELLQISRDFLKKPDMKFGIAGHSMGGHGALTIAFKNPALFTSVSALAPICSPAECPWGKKAFSNYLSDVSEWSQYDACQLIQERSFSKPILVHQGKDDEFLQEQLKPDLLEKVCKDQGVDLQLRYCEGYDHSFFFVSSFIEEHLNWFAKTL